MKISKVFVLSILIIASLILGMSAAKRTESENSSKSLKSQKSINFGLLWNNVKNTVKRAAYVSVAAIRCKSHCGLKVSKIYEVPSVKKVVDWFKSAFGQEVSVKNPYWVCKCTKGKVSEFFAATFESDKKATDPKTMPASISEFLGTEMKFLE